MADFFLSVKQFFFAAKKVSLHSQLTCGKLYKYEIDIWYSKEGMSWLENVL